MNVHRRLGSLDWSAGERTGGVKRPYVVRMFEIIAPRYDVFTRWFSYGMDGRWKRQLVSWAGERRIGAVLDVACGTGDLLSCLRQRVPVDSAAAVDTAIGMLVTAKVRVAGAAAIAADMAELPFLDDAFDVATAGYAFRNVEQLDAAISEAFRVLKPGGHLLSLDFYCPESPLWRRCFVAYLRFVGSIYGLILHREASVYRYIAESIEHYLQVSEYENLLRRHGFRIERRRMYLLGGIGLHCAAKALSDDR